MQRASSPPARRALNGVLLLDKPVGITSQLAVLRAKRLFFAAKAGHTGTLDPMASGLLPVCFGEATKFSHALIDADKQYLATLKLGVTTTTGDMEGAVTSSAPVRADHSTIRNILAALVGEVLQTPPMYSAVKHAGKPLYRYARAGMVVERTPRPVRIKRLDLECYSGDELCVSVECSKGTYVRVLAEDIGRALGCGACLESLRRTAAGNFRIEQAVTLDRLDTLALEERDEALRPVDSLVAGLPRVDLDENRAKRIRTGVVVDSLEPLPQGLVRIYGPGQDYLGIAITGAGPTLTPRRLMATRKPEPGAA